MNVRVRVLLAPTVAAGLVLGAAGCSGEVAAQPPLVPACTPMLTNEVQDYVDGTWTLRAQAICLQPGQTIWLAFPGDTDRWMGVKGPFNDIISVPITKNTVFAVVVADESAAAALQANKGARQLLPSGARIVRQAWT